MDLKIREIPGCDPAETNGESAGILKWYFPSYGNHLCPLSFPQFRSAFLNHQHPTREK